MQQKNCERILFVDIDGVFNKQFGLHTHVNVGIIPGDVMDIDIVQFFARLLRPHSRNGLPVKIVGCSSWFSPHRPEKNETLFKRIAAETGLVISDVVSDTGGWIGRSKAVLDYVVEHNPTYWCVLDDGDYYYSQNHIGHTFFASKPYYDIRMHFVKPHGRYGMSNGDIENILQVLGLVTSAYGTSLNKRRILEKFEEAYGNKNSDRELG